MLDAGAAGFLFPHVSSVAEAAELVSWCQYKPVVYAARASLRHEGKEHERRGRAHDDVVCIMIVKSLDRKSNLSEILAVDGVTGVAIGPDGISMELGCADWNDPRVVQALTEMAGVAIGFPDRALPRLALTPDEAAAHVKGGANMILLNHDTSLIKGMYAGRFQSNGKAISHVTFMANKI
jgi:2-keto-3-deoxy-L-rhamnonate aldolase RhmA